MKLKIELSNKWDLGFFIPRADPFIMTSRYRLFRTFNLLAVLIGILSISSGSGDIFEVDLFIATCRWMAVGCATIALLAVGSDMLGELRIGRLNLVSVFAIVFLLAFAGMILFFPW